MTIPSSDLKRWAELAAKATPGPWTVHPEFHDPNLDTYPTDGQTAIVGPPNNGIDSAQIDVISVVWYDGGHLIITPADTAFIAEARTAVPALLAEIEGFRQALDMALGPHCSGCGNAIDPDCCWCGDGPESKHFDETHGFIPMGCDCCRGERDWKKAASALRETLWKERKENALLTDKLRVSEEQNVENERLRAEVSALRGSLIHAVDLRSASADNERQLWAMRHVANRLSEPFSHDRVQDKYNEHPEMVTALRSALSKACDIAADGKWTSMDPAVRQVQLVCIAELRKVGQ